MKAKYGAREIEGGSASENARIARGESKNVVAESTGIPRSTLVRLYEDDQRRAVYPGGTAPDNRLDRVLNEFRPLPEIDIDANEEELRAVIRDVVRDEPDYTDHTRVR